MLTSLALFSLGLVLLVAGAEALVRGASRVARVLGISPLVIGLTVVAFGTSAPEMAVSVGSALRGEPDIAVGNVVGSNILNVLVILGLAALIAPLTVARKLVRMDVPLMIGVSVLTLLLALDGHLGRLDGALLFAGIIAYTVHAIVQGRREGAAVQDEFAAALGEEARGATGVARHLVLVAGGLVLLVIGANWLVDGAVVIARLLGVSELVIGLTIVAAGTSLPEVATSVMAALRRERDIAIGNVVGSNLFNLMAVLGLVALVAPEGVRVAASALRFDIPVMIAVAVACLPIFFTGYSIARWEGLLFLAYYVAYVAYLIMAAGQHDALDAYSTVMLAFVIPLTVITLMVLVINERRTVRTG